MGKITIILMEGPGSLKAWNALRAATAFLGSDMDLTIFLMDDGVYNVKEGLAPVDGLREMNTAKKLAELQELGAEVVLCGTCRKARGLQDSELIKGVRVGSMMDMAKSVKESKAVLTF